MSTVAFNEIPSSLFLDFEEKEKGRFVQFLNIFNTFGLYKSEKRLERAIPILTGIIGVGGVVANLLRWKLKANKDDLVGYTVFGFEKEISL